MLFSKSFDKKLYSAFEFYSENYCKTLPSKEELKYITFSSSFERKMLKLISAQKKSYYYIINTVGKRIAILIAALLIGITAITFSVRASRETVLQFIVEIFDTHTHVYIKNSGDINFLKITPEYVPDGFKIIYENDSENKCEIRWESGDKYFEYIQKESESEDLNFRSKNAFYKKIRINALDGIRYTKDGVTYFLFGNENYFFKIYGNISKKELEKIADSLPCNSYVEMVKVVPQYIPDGFEIINAEQFEDAHFIDYYNSEKMLIRYSQQLNAGSPTGIDTEGAKELKTVYINDLEGISFYNKGYSHIVFGNENNYFHLYGEIPMEEMIKIAESIPVPPPLTPIKNVK